MNVEKLKGPGKNVAHDRKKIKRGSALCGRFKTEH
jgi:hypothetical protein